MTDFKREIFVEVVPSCSRRRLSAGDSTSITCHSYHFGKIKWFKIDPSTKEAKEITDEQKVKLSHAYTGHGLDQTNLTLYLRDVTVSDSGAYVCSKSNGLPNETRNVTVSIEVSGMLLIRMPLIPFVSVCLSVCLLFD